MDAYRDLAAERSLDLRLTLLLSQLWRLVLAADRNARDSSRTGSESDTDRLTR
jgi:hypothetical protein